MVCMSWVTQLMEQRMYLHVVKYLVFELQVFIPRAHHDAEKLTDI